MESNCIASELFFEGAKIHVSSDKEIQCPVTFTSKDDPENVVGNIFYEYKLSKTPTITDMTPDFGRNMGGTEVTISGVNLGLGDEV